MKATILLPTLAAIGGISAQGGGFYSACSGSWSLGWRGAAHFMVDTCAGVKSTLNLNDCLTNKEGVLAAMKVGRAFNSCNACTASATDGALTCNCQTTGGQWLPTTIDLDTLVSTNGEGVLTCFDLPGIDITS